MISSLKYVNIWLTLFMSGNCTLGATNIEITVKLRSDGKNIACGLIHYFVLGNHFHKVESIHTQRFWLKLEHISLAKLGVPFFLLLLEHQRTLSLSGTTMYQNYLHSFLRKSVVPQHFLFIQSVVPMIYSLIQCVVNLGHLHQFLVPHPSSALC